MPPFPRRVPDSLVGIVDPLIDILGSLVPAADAQHTRKALSEMDLRSVWAVGLEVVLPPHPPACDLSVLVPPRHVPDFARTGHDVLSALAMSAGASDSTWWELDTSVQPSPVGAFVRSTESDALPLVRSVAAGIPGLERAIAALEDVIKPHWHGMGRLVGFFPNREPSPVAAALVPGSHQAITGLIREVDSRATIAVAPDSDLIAHLLKHLDGSAIAVAADADGRTAVSWEGFFREREHAMVESRWAPALLPEPVWGDAAPSLSSLLAVQGIHTFDAVPTVRVLSGIDHVKIGPDGKVKAYVGAHIVMQGQR